VVWINLGELVHEVVLDDRVRGYLQGKTDLPQDRIWLHWGGDSGGWLRGIKHSKFGFKLAGNGRAIAQSPLNLKTCLLFEGKDNYSNYSEYLQPILPVMHKLQDEGIKVENTQYAVTQTFGADYVLMAEMLGHGGASSTNGCCLCDQHKKDYGTIVTNAEGRRVPLAANPRTLEQMAAAAHRPLQPGPGIECPYCQEQFPDQETVDASVGPQNDAERTAYQLKHCGMRFGSPPLFRVPVDAWVVCALHCLLRLTAITFQRTILVNLDTKEKVEAINQVIKDLHLGCKKVELRKTTGGSRADTAAMSFTGM
jgi:hypothetical protein